MKRIITMVTAILISGWTFAQNIDTYFEIAAKNNPGLLAKYKIFEAAMQRVDQAKALPDPTLSFGYFISPVETRVGTQRAKFSLNQMFPWFGTLKARGDATSMLAEAKFQNYMNAHNKLYYQVARAYYPIYELNKLIEIEHENIELLEAYKTLAVTHFENGKGAMVDALRVDIMKKDSETNLKILQEKKQFLDAEFNRLLNRDMGTVVIVSDTIVLGEESLDLEKKALEGSHPLLRELDFKIDASKAQERQAIKEGLPNLGVGLNYVMIGERPNINLPDNGKDALMPMFRMSLPIFRGKYKASKHQAQLNQKAYSLMRIDMENNLEASYEKALFDINKNKSLINLYKHQINESQQSLDLLFVAYSTSGNDFEEVLRMEQQLLNYEKLNIKAISSYMISLAEMDYITAKTKKNTPIKN